MVFGIFKRGTSCTGDDILRVKQLMQKKETRKVKANLEQLAQMAIPLGDSGNWQKYKRDKEVKEMLSEWPTVNASKHRNADARLLE
jgi:hypothetical protein